MPIERVVLRNPDEAAARLDQRARVLEVLSRIYLAVIGLLLLAAAVVFYVAPSITSGDIEHASPKGLQALEENNVQLDDQYRQTNEDIAGKTNRVKAVLAPFLQNAAGLNIIMPRATAPIYNCCVYPSTNFPTFVQMASKLRETVEKAQPLEQDGLLVSGTLGFGESFGGARSRKDWIDLADKLEALKFPLSADEEEDLKKKEKHAADVSAQISHNVDVIQGVKNGLTNQEVEHLLNDNDVRGLNAKNSTILRLIQTTITRFGTLTIIIFLVSILSGLYRYTVKLVGFYHALADALRLTGGERPSTFYKLATTLTPSIDFGKVPTTPIEQVVQLVDALSRIRKAERGDD